MKIREIKTKTIIAKSNLPGCDYVINPYIGCLHCCLYCYARFMKRFTGHAEPWGTFVDVKINAPELIPQNTNKYKNKSIFLSSVTDPYLPLEKKYQLTRRILEKLIKLQPDLGLQTKSKLVLRDIDLLKQFKNCEVGVTITTLDDNIRREIEPNAASVDERLNLVKQLKEAGLETYIFIGPILPHFTDWQQIVDQTKKYSGFYMFENLTVRRDIWQSVKQWLARDHPSLLSKYQQIYFTKNDYWDKIEREIEGYAKDNKLDFRVYFHH